MKTIVVVVCVMLETLLYAQVRSLKSGNWNDASVWQGAVIPNSSTTDVQIVSGHTITLNGNITVRNIEISNGKINLGPNVLQIYGNITGTQRNNIYSNTMTEISILESSNADTFLFPLNINDFRKLIINRKRGAISTHSLHLDNAVPSNGIVLVLTNGVLYMNNGSILYLNSKQIERDIASSDSSHVDGIVQRNIPKNSGLYIFPVGNKGVSRPFGVATQNGNSDNINQVRFIYDTPINFSNVNTSELPGGIMPYFYWKHDIITGANPQRRLYYKETDFPNINADKRKKSMTLANSNGVGSWGKATTGWSVYDENSYIEFDNANASNSTYWTLGSILSDVSYQDIHLPIELIDFEAKQIAVNKIELRWITASETNNNYFEILKMSNNTDFESENIINTKGNGRKLESYKYIDTKISSKTMYYRLKQVDLDGSESLSKIISIVLSNKENASISIWRKGRTLLFEIPENVDFNQTIIITDVNGKVIKKYCLQNIDNSFDIPQSGYYFVSATNENNVENFKIFVP